MTAGLISFIGLYTWNFFDAVKVAKIKNMVLRKEVVDFQIEPFFENGFGNKVDSIVIGFSLTLNF